MKTKVKYLLLIGLFAILTGCSSALKDDKVYIVHEITEGNNIQYIVPFSKAINQEIKNESVSWIHGINIYNSFFGVLSKAILRLRTFIKHQFNKKFN